MIPEAMDEIMAKKQTAKRLVVGIDGLSGAGKTTLVDVLQRKLEERNVGVAVVHIDDLIVDRSTRYQTGLDEWKEHYFVQWDVERMKHTLFQPWVEGQLELELDFYDSTSDTVSSRRLPVPEDGILLIEGIFLQRKEWRSYFDYVLYVDCPRETRFERVTKRSNQDPIDEARLAKYRNRYWAAEDYYLQEEKPLEQADLVIET